MNNMYKDIPEWHIIFKSAEMWSSKPNYSPNHTLTQTNTQTNTRQHCCYKDMRMSETLLRESTLSSCVLTLTEFISKSHSLSSCYSQKSKNIYPLYKKWQFLNSISLLTFKTPAAYCFIPPTALISSSIGSSGVELLLSHLDISHLHIHMDFYYLDN